MTDTPPAATEVETPHEAQDPNGKKDVTGYQDGFLEEVQAALDAGFVPDDNVPEYLPESAQADVWKGVGQ